MYKRILLACDGSAPGQQALLDCHEIAQWSHSDLTLIAVMQLPLASVRTEGLVYAGTVQKGEKARYQTILETGVRKLADAGLHVRGKVVVGDVVRKIADLCPPDQNRPDRGRPPASEQLDGSVVAQLRLQGLDRAGTLQRTGGDHAVKGLGMAHGVEACQAACILNQPVGSVSATGQKSSATKNNGTGPLPLGAQRSI
jgi:hypothetical protein